MKFPVVTILSLACSLMCCSTGFAEAKPGTKQLGRQIENFQLKDYRGRERSFQEFDEKKLVVVAFLGTECPLAKLYAPRLVELANMYQEKGVGFLGINANTQDSLTEVAAYARIHKIPFPIVKDLGNKVADQFHAVRTPEVFVLDANRKVRYWGRIDDQYGVGYIRPDVEREDLKIALDELLAGKTVSQPVAESVGCYIGRVREPKADSPVTYSNQIARILQKNCVECHREGQIAPFTLTDYDEVVGWAETILEVVEDQRMPPWHANPKYGHFANERSLTQQQKQQLATWVENGAPEGDPKDLPKQREFVTDWRLPKQPDQIIPMSGKPFTVKAEGTVKYKYFTVDPGFKNDVWISGAEVIPGNLQVVHHAVVLVQAPGEVRQEGIGWIAAYVPGQSTTMLPKGYGRRVPAGSKLIFQMHYTPNGSVQEDLTKVGLIYTTEEEVEQEVITMICANDNIKIPAHADNHRQTASFDEIPADGKLLTLAPHMHLRGKSFQFQIEYPNGRNEILLDVPNYDFNWQTSYRLAEQLTIPKGSRIICIAHFDNSEDNLVNPDPTIEVRWGDQTWEEMLVGYFEVAIPRTATKKIPERKLSLKEIAQSKVYVASMFGRFDQNKNGKIERTEVPDDFAAFAFGRMDLNGDDEITNDEATKAIQTFMKQREPRKRDEE